MSYPNEDELEVKIALSVRRTPLLFFVWALGSPAVNKRRTDATRSAAGAVDCSRTVRSVIAATGVGVAQ